MLEFPNFAVDGAGEEIPLDFRSIFTGYIESGFSSEVITVVSTPAELYQIASGCRQVPPEFVDYCKSIFPPQSVYRKLGITQELFNYFFWYSLYLVGKLLIAEELHDLKWQIGIAIEGFLIKVGFDNRILMTAEQLDNFLAGNYSNLNYKDFAEHQMLSNLKDRLNLLSLRFPGGEVNELFWQIASEENLVRLKPLEIKHEVAEG